MNATKVDIAGGGAGTGQEGAQAAYRDSCPPDFQRTHGRQLGITLCQLCQRALGGFFTANNLIWAQMCLEAVFRLFTTPTLIMPESSDVEARIK